MKQNEPTTMTPEYLQLLSEAQSPSTDFTDPVYSGIRHNRVLSLSGTLPSGAAVFTFVPSVLGAAPDLHKLLLFFVRELHDVITTNDAGYCMVFCQSGASSFRGVGISFLRRVYKILGRRFKKNIKALLILHPTNALKTLFFFARPFISTKFWRKVHYFQTGSELVSSELLSGAVWGPGSMGKKGVLVLPTISMSIDDGLPLTGTWTARDSPIRFMGCPVEHELINSYGIPDFLSTCYQLLGMSLNTDGMFRISADSDETSSLLRTFETAGVSDNTTESIFAWYEQQKVELGEIPSECTHTLCVLLKTYLRERPEPLFPKKVYAPLIALFRGLKLVACQQEIDLVALRSGITSLLSQMLTPVEINNLFVFLLFLNKVALQKEHNRMDVQNLCVVFSPNVLRPPPPVALDPNADASEVQKRVGLLQQALEEINYTIQLLKFMVENVTLLFSVRVRGDGGGGGGGGGSGGSGGSGGVEYKRDPCEIMTSIDNGNIGNRVVPITRTKLVVVVRVVASTGASSSQLNEAVENTAENDSGVETKVTDGRRSGGVFDKVTATDMEVEEEMKQGQADIQRTVAAAEKTVREKLAKEQAAAKNAREKQEKEAKGKTVSTEDVAVLGVSATTKTTPATPVTPATPATAEKEKEFFRLQKEHKEEEMNKEAEKERLRREKMSPEERATLEENEAAEKKHEMDQAKALKLLAGSYGAKKKKKKGGGNKKKGRMSMHTKPSK